MQESREIITKYDVDGNGSLSKVEATAMVRGLGCAPPLSRVSPEGNRGPRDGYFGVLLLNEVLASHGKARRSVWCVCGIDHRSHYTCMLCCRYDVVPEYIDGVWDTYDTNRDGELQVMSIPYA
jgi:hypothetical protein